MKTITMLLLLLIWLQTFSEGTALRRKDISQWKRSFLGQLSSIVEPIATVVVALFVLKMRGILPYALCFAAGAMIFVVVEELILESQRKYEHLDLVTMATRTGFIVMMILDLALG